jgi:hypothetical protein
MGGLFTELGPFVTSDLSFPNGPNTGPYTVQLNNYTCESLSSSSSSSCHPAACCMATASMSVAAVVTGS